MYIVVQNFKKAEPQIPRGFQGFGILSQKSVQSFNSRDFYQVTTRTRKNSLKGRRYKGAH